MNLVLAAITVMFRGFMAQLSLTRQPRTSKQSHQDQRFVPSIGTLKKLCEFLTAWAEQTVFGITEKKIN
jgi:hypothetical protein